MLLAVTTEADAGKKRLTRYVASEVCKPVKPLTEESLGEESGPSSGSVTNSLPAPPPGQKWRVAFAVNANGFVVRIFLGDDQVGSGLIRWDRSYRLDLHIKDLDIAGSPVDITGRLEGCDINAKDPITKVTGKIGGLLELADGITVSNGELAWDHDGMRLTGDARIRCTVSGVLKGTALIDYRGADEWNLHVLGSTDGPTCVMDGDFSIGDATIGGTITAKKGIVDGKITGRANVSAPDLPFGPWAATFQVLLTGPMNKIWMDFSADAESEAGYAKVTTDANGELVITLNLKGGQTASGDVAPSTGGGYVDPASLLPAPVKTAAPCVIPSIKRGVTLTSARRAMTKAGCSVRVKRVRSTKVKKWRVVGLYVKRGTRFAPGRAITVRVSYGPPKRRCVIPSIKRGVTLTSARRAMTKAGCSVRVKRVRSTKVRKGRVVGLYVKRGKTYRAGTKVTVRVAS